MSQQTKFKKYRLLGVEVDAATTAQAIDYIAAVAANPQSPACYVTKPYVEFLDQAYADREIRQLLNQSELSMADGVALSWAAYYLYGGAHNVGRLFYTLAQIVLQPDALRKILPERAAGTNFTWPLLERCQSQRLSVFLIGSPKHNAITYTAAAIKRRLPDLQIVGTAAGEVAGQQHAQLQTALRTGHPERELAETLMLAKPDVILVGMGFPLQEQLMARLVQHLPHGVLIGEGGTFDYRSFGGQRPKAPRLMQATGLEWLWRLMLEPRRLRRQLAIPRFIWRVWREGKKGLGANT
ncbi:WecB/TagA/CpsF family glycosyltransferase [Candidatus Parcubacteria bacterium]|nr:WecB/TagA/CpsF family glycosyltransferase [Candidatus Parcubacteria bacterium]